YLALFAQHPVLAPQPGKLLPLLAGQPIEATAPIALRLRHPVANRLGGRLELLREIVRTTPCAHQLHHSAPVFRRIPCMTLGHRGSPPLSPLRHCPRNRVNSKGSPLPLVESTSIWLEEVLNVVLRCFISEAAAPMYQINTQHLVSRSARQLR